jgi:hypothetical protein
MKDVLYHVARSCYFSSNVAVCSTLIFKGPMMRVVLQEFLELKGLSLGLQTETGDKILTSLFTDIHMYGCFRYAEFFGSLFYFTVRSINVYDRGNKL